LRAVPVSFGEVVDILGEFFREFGEGPLDEEGICGHGHDGRLVRKEKTGDG
jgi:hypothetical protein